MGKLQRALLAEARELVAGELAAHPVFAPGWDRLAVILSGSAVTEYADEHSGIDLIVLGDAGELNRLRSSLEAEADAADRDELFEVTLGGRRVTVKLLEFQEAAQLLEAYDDFALAVLPGAPVLHDPGGRLAGLAAGPVEIPRQILAAKIADRYRKVRRRQASIAWNLRRGQPYVLLDNLTRLLGHALAICFYLEGRPPTGRKWIFQGALRTAAGRRLRPHLFQLFSSLGDLATLGGSFEARSNRIYTMLTTLHDALLESIRAAGYDAGRDGVREGSPT